MKFLEEYGHKWYAEETHPDKRCFKCSIKRSYYLDFVKAGRRDLVAPCVTPKHTSSRVGN